MLRGLADLARRHAVALFDGDGFVGGGFLVTADTVVTCAHVVAYRGPLHILRDGTCFPAELVSLFPADPGDGDYHAYPDLALLALKDPVEDGLEGVWLADEPPREGATVVAYGYSDHTPEPGVAPDTLRLTVAGVGGGFVRVLGDRVVPGFSGSLVLDEVTGRVCGVVKASRDWDEVQGGWIVPAPVLPAVFAGLAARLPEHRPGGTWFDLARERARRQEEIFGRDFRGRARTPASLLVAAQETIPFVHRAELADLVEWCEGRGDVQGIVRLVHAPGGAGKTRLAARLCADRREHGWLAGFLAGGDLAAHAEKIVDGLDAGFPVLLVLDYAQDRLASLGALLDHLARYVEPDAPIRVLLLARSHRPWWEALPAELGAAGDWALYRSRAVALPHLTDSIPAADLAEDAFRVFSEQLGGPGGEPPASLRVAARGHRSVLAVHALALDAALTLRQGDSWDHWNDPLVRILRHEAQAWRRGLARRGAPDLAEQILPEALLLVPTLVPGLGERDTTAVLRRVLDALPAAPALDPEPVWRTLRELYGRRDGTLAPVEPDRITEVLVRTVFRALADAPSAAGYLIAVAEGGRHAFDAGLQVLARARGCTTTGRIVDDDAYPVLDAALDRLLRRNPAALLPSLAGICGVLPHAEPMAPLMTDLARECEPAVLHATEPRLPRYHTALSAPAAVIYRRLLEDLGDADGTPARLRRVHLLTHAAFRFGETGRYEEGLSAAAEAAAICEDLARGGDGAHRAAHAAALNNLSLLLGARDDAGGSLRHNLSAERIYRELIDDPEQPGDHRIDLAAILNNQAILLNRRDRPAEAVIAAASAVRLYEQIMPSPRQEDGIAKALHNLALAQPAQGDLAEALASSRRAVDVYRDLAVQNPGRHLLDMLDAMQINAVLLSLHDDGALRSAYLMMSEVARRRRSFVHDRRDLRHKQRQALSFLQQWAARLPEFTKDRAEWSNESDMHAALPDT
ncbi:trypsin-like peptidase domain-containing protein [Actinomadura sp. 3N508]|uniref:trypsin-like peptidase domain-containing protein n=1 Tax=Actinomadura sp. 3N508 TaxID=3375153 RepID=UPI003796E366